MEAKSPGRSQHRLKILGIKLLNWRAWLAIAVVVGFYLFLYGLGRPTHVEIEQLRTQFHLRENVPLKEVYVDRSRTKPFPADIEGVVHFTEAQFRDYVLQLDDKSLWRPSPIAHGGIVYQGRYAPNALMWQNARDARQLAWGRLSSTQAQQAVNGRLLCFLVQAPLDASSEGIDPIRGEACGAQGSLTMNAVLVQGLLDLDSMTLHMLIRQTRARKGK